MVNPTFSISGLSSGLDTAGIIDQLVQLERQPIVRYQQRQAQLRRRDDAWGSVVGKLSGLRTALDAVSSQAKLRGLVQVSSSDEAAVSVEPTGSGTPGNYDFTVTQLAARHRVGMNGQLAGGSSLVGAGTITFTDPDTGATLGEVTTDDTTTLAGLARRIDELGVGIDAQVLKVGDGNFQLVLTSLDSGAGGRFDATATQAGLGAAVQLEEGRDALLQLGTLQISRSSNVIDDLVEGATIRLRRTTTEDVSINVERDTEAAVGKLKALVEGFNSVLSEVKKLTRYDPDSNTAGVLQGDSLARDLAGDLRATLTKLVGGGTGDLRYAGDIGLGLTREGLVQLDETKLRAALGKDFEGAVGFLTQSISGDEGVALSYVGEGATSGTFTAAVSQAATVASMTGASFTPPTGSPKTFTITTSSGTNVSVTIDDAMTASQAVARIQAALSAAEVTDLTVTGDDDAGTLSLTANRHGSAGSFTVSDYVDGDGATEANGLAGSYTGNDVVASFTNAQGVTTGPVTGTGRSVVGSGPAAGLTLDLSGAIGSYGVSFSDGVAGAIDRYVSRLEGRDGLIQSARDSLDSSIRDFDDQIEQYERRVALRESRLRRQFTGLESALGQLQAQGSWLAGQLGSFAAPR